MRAKNQTLLGRLPEPQGGVYEPVVPPCTANYRCTQLSTTDAGAVSETHTIGQADTGGHKTPDKQRIRTVSLPPSGGSVVPGRGSSSRTSPQMKDPRTRDTFNLRDPPKDQRGHTYGCNQQEVLLITHTGTRASWSREPSAPRWGTGTPYVAKSAGTEADAWLQDFHWSIQMRREVRLRLPGLNTRKLRVADLALSWAHFGWEIPGNLHP